MEKVIGIYRFYNKKNTIYVGQSVDCYKRLQKHRMNSWYKKDK